MARLHRPLAALLTAAALLIPATAGHAAPGSAQIIGTGTGGAFRVIGVSSPTPAALQATAADLPENVVWVQLAGTTYLDFTNNDPQSAHTIRLGTATVAAVPGATVPVEVTFTEGCAIARVTATSGDVTASIKVCVL
jgi:hypothetical protein